MAKIGFWLKGDIFGKISKEMLILVHISRYYTSINLVKYVGCRQYKNCGVLPTPSPTNSFDYFSFQCDTPQKISMHICEGLVSDYTHSRLAHRNKKKKMEKLRELVTYLPFPFGGRVLTLMQLLFPQNADTFGKSTIFTGTIRGCTKC